MPWKACKPMDERLKLMARLLDGEKMAVVCREFGISRSTGYKIFNRYKDHGLLGLEDRSRRPYRHPTVNHISGMDLDLIGAPDRIRTCDPLIKIRNLNL